MKLRLIAFAIFALAALLLLTRSRGDPSTRAASATDADPKLTHSIAEIRFADVPLEQAFDQLQSVAHVTIVPDWPALESAGVTRKSPVVLRLFDLPVTRAIALVLAQVCDSSETSCPLAYADDGAGVVHVSTESLLRGEGVLRMYDVADILDRLFDTATSWPAGVAHRFTRQERVDELTRLIALAVETESWSTRVGKPFDDIHEVAGRLFIVQTRKNHQLIERMLMNLRKMQADRSRNRGPATRGIDLLERP